jgi:hypothetical protein
MQRKAPLLPQAGRRAVRFQVGGVDHDPIRRVALPGQTGKDPLEDPAPAPANEPVVEGLVGAVLPGCVPPLQPIADHIDDPADHPLVVNTRLAVRAGEMRLDASHLLVAQQEQISHGGHLHHP